MARSKRFAILPLFLCFIVLLNGCGPRKIPGNEWLLGLSEPLQELTLLSKEMDDVYALYVIGSMDSSDFANERLLLKLKYSACLKDYEEYNGEHPVYPGGHSWLSKKGQSAMESVYEEIQLLLDCSVDKDGSPIPYGQLLYLYLSYRTNLSGHLADFQSASDLIGFSDAQESVSSKEEVSK